MLRCSNCDTLLSEKDLVAVTIGERTFVACPSCLLEFLEETQDDIEEIPDRYLTGLTFHFVENVQEVLLYALLDEKVDHPVDLTIREDTKPETTA